MTPITPAILGVAALKAAITTVNGGIGPNGLRLGTARMWCWLLTTICLEEEYIVKRILLTLL